MSLRIGIVGAGANTRTRHLPGFQAIEGVCVSAVCNRTRASSQKVADAFHIPRVFDDWKALVLSDEVDAVCVGTWPCLHAPISIQALNAGKHILTEARMAMNLVEAHAMLAASRRSDKVSMIVPAPFYLEYEPRLLEMREAGFFGEILEIHLRHLAGRYDPDSPATWRQDKALSGNNIMGLGIWNETIHRYAGLEKSVQAWGKVFVQERRDPATGKLMAMKIPDSIGVLAEMENGATAVYHLSAHGSVAAGPELLIHGTKAGMRLADGKAWVAQRGDADWAPLGVPKAQQGGWHVEQDFVDAIREGKPVTRTPFKDRKSVV